MFASMTTFLVAVDDEDVPVGLCLSNPVETVLDMIEGLGLAPEQAHGLHTVALVGVVKVTALAVDPAHRGAGLGAALLERTVTMAAQRQAWYVYGQTRADDNLTDWYRSAGMTVLPAGQGLDLSPLFMLPLAVTPEPGSHIFVTSRGALPVRAVAPDHAGR
jgi:GNAT superfamily N-acetyltransferase